MKNSILRHALVWFSIQVVQLEEETRFTVRKIEFSFSTLEDDKNQLTPRVLLRLTIHSSVDIHTDDPIENLMWYCVLCFFLLYFWHVVFKE